MGHRKKAARNQADSKGGLWTVREVYTHRTFALSVALALYMQLDRIRRDALAVEQALTGQGHTDTKAVLKRLYGAAYEETLHAAVGAVYFQSVPAFMITSASDEVSANYVSGRHTGRICPHCHSKEFGCLYNRFWESFTVSQPASGKTWLQVRKCTRTNKLFIHEHAIEALLLDGCRTRAAGPNHIEIRDNNDKPVTCPMCQHDEFILDATAMHFRCARDYTPVLIFDKNNIDQQLEYESLSNNMHTRNDGIRQFLNSWPACCDIPYDGRPINGPPFSQTDLRLVAAGYDKPLTEDQAMAANAFAEIEMSQITDLMNRADRAGLLRFYRLQSQSL